MQNGRNRQQLECEGLMPGKTLTSPTLKLSDFVLRIWTRHTQIKNTLQQKCVCGEDPKELKKDILSLVSINVKVCFNASNMC